MVIKPKKCKICRESFSPRNSLQTICGQLCATKFANNERSKRIAKEAKLERSNDKVRKQALKRRGDYLKDAQTAFNAYRREWCKINGYTTCPCCGKPLDWNSNKVDAGHFRSVGSAPHMRFTENNVWAQRKQCNQFGSGNAVDYRIGLIQRIGLEAVELLENDNTVRKWSIEDLQEITRTYRAKLREIKTI